MDLYLIFMSSARGLCVPRNFACLPWPAPLRSDPSRSKPIRSAARSALACCKQRNWLSICCKLLQQPRQHSTAQRGAKSNGNRETYLDYRRIKFMYILFSPWPLWARGPAFASASASASAPAPLRLPSTIIPMSYMPIMCAPWPFKVENV